MVRPTTCPRPSSSASGGSKRRPKLPELVKAPAPPSRRLGGELTGQRDLRLWRLSPVVGHLTPRSGTCSAGFTAPLPSSARGQRGHAKPSRRVSGKPGAIQKPALGHVKAAVHQRVAVLGGVAQKDA